MRRIVYLLAGVLAVLALGSDSPREYDDRTEVIGIDGTWQLVGDEAVLLICQGATWTIKTGGDGTLWHGTHHLDTTRKPPRMERYYADGPYQGKVYKFIYQVDGDSLKIGASRNEAVPPKRFDDPLISVYRYKRMK